MDQALAAVSDLAASTQKLDDLSAQVAVPHRAGAGDGPPAAGARGTAARRAAHRQRRRRPRHRAARGDPGIRRPLRPAAARQAAAAQRPQHRPDARSAREPDGPRPDGRPAERQHLREGYRPARRRPSRGATSRWPRVALAAVDKVAGVAHPRGPRPLGRQPRGAAGRVQRHSASRWIRPRSARCCARCAIPTCAADSR